MPITVFECEPCGYVTNRLFNLECHSKRRCHLRKIGKLPKKCMRIKMPVKPIPEKKLPEEPKIKLPELIPEPEHIPVKKDEKGNLVIDFNKNDGEPNEIIHIEPLKINRPDILQKIINLCNKVREKDIDLNKYFTYDYYDENVFNLTDYELDTFFHELQYYYCKKNEL